MHLACCQLGMAWEDKPANYRQAETLLDAAGVSAGTLVLLPEMFATGFTMDSENQCYLAAVNRNGRDPSGLAYSGRSQIIDPRGAIMADAGQQEGVIQAPVDLDARRVYRREFPALRDRRR